MARNDKKNSMWDKAVFRFLGDTAVSWIVKILIIASIAIAISLSTIFGMSTLSAACTVGGYAYVVILLVTSDKIRNYFLYRSIAGYWKYKIKPNEDAEGSDDQHEKESRIVKIENIDGDLLLKGWRCDIPDDQYFESTKVVLSNPRKRSGCLVYWYVDPLNAAKKESLNGIVVLSWDTFSSVGAIKSMEGWYTGKATNISGGISYQRITEEEFSRLRKGL